MAFTKEDQAKQIAELQKQAEANQAVISKIEAGGRGAGDQELEGLYAKQRGFHSKIADIDKRQTIASDIKQGMELGKELVPMGSLQRLSSTKLLEKGEESIFRDPLGRVDSKLGRASVTDLATQLGRMEKTGLEGDKADILARRKDALGGLDAQQLAATRAKAGQEIGRQSETTRRRLAEIQASQGVRGGTAAAQQLAAVMGGEQTRANFEQDLLLKQQGIQQQALGNYEATVLQQERTQQESQKFDLSQQLQERNLQNMNINRQFQAQQVNLQQQLKERNLEQFNIQQGNRERDLKRAEIEIRMAERNLEKVDMQQANAEMLAQHSLGLILPQSLNAERIAEVQAGAVKATGGGGGGGSVLCTVMYNNNLISSEVYKKDCVIGAYIEKIDPDLVKGYRLWATPIARFLEKHKQFIPYVKSPIIKWANSMYEGKELDTLFYRLGKSFSRMVGKFHRLYKEEK